MWLKVKPQFKVKKEIVFAQIKKHRRCVSVQKRPLTPEDRALFASPGDPQISPDGKSIAFVVQEQNSTKDRLQTNIFIVASSGGKPVKLTNSGSDRLPSWCPLGQTLAFVSDRGGKPGIWLIDTAGGEPRCIKTTQRVMSRPCWSPDGTKIAFLSSVVSTQPDTVSYPGAPREDAYKPVSKNDHETTSDSIKVITKIRHKFDGVGFFGNRRMHVFMVWVKDSEPTTEPIEATRLTEGDFDHDAPSWSPDGRHIAVCVTRSEEQDPIKKADIWAIDVETLDMRQLLDAQGMSNAPVWSADGTKIAYIGHSTGFLSSTSAEARWFEVHKERAAHESDVSSFSRVLDRPAGGIPSSDIRYANMLVPPVWSSDGYCYFVIGDQGSSFVYRAKPGAEPERVAGSPGWVIASMTFGGGVLAYQMGSGSRPDEIFSHADTALQLTDFSGRLAEELHFSEQQPISYAARDGLKISGWLLKPRGYEPGKKYPLILHIHGGPHGVYGNSFQFQGQMLASQGYAVLYTNPRGSQGYGQQFAFSCVRDWGGEDFHDIMRGVDHVIQMGVADSERLGVTGWSYGGFMTCWTLTQTDRFKAAVTGACISNRHSFYGTSDVGHTFGEHHFGGTPWSETEVLLERSPLQYVENIKAPVLILHGEADLRCPVEQGEQFFTALKRLGKQAVFVRYPGEYHAFKKPSHWIDRLRRIQSWFDHYLGR